MLIAFHIVAEVAADAAAADGSLGRDRQAIQPVYQPMRGGETGIFVDCYSGSTAVAFAGVCDAGLWQGRSCRGSP